MDLRPGVMVGDHARLLRPLGEGGMGTVWVAEHLRLETEVAVKLIADPALRKDEGLMERLRREAKAAARIRSPHVVHIYDHGAMPDGTAFLLMELLEGESLADRITRQRTLDFLITADIVAQTAAALEAAHAISIVHRDIKPDNIFLTGDPARPFVKVLDFGIALRRGVDSPELRLTATDRIVGTPAYMSPEQLLSAKEPGPHVDFWALAVTAYEMLTGEMPFEGETLGSLMMAVTSGKFVQPSTRWSTLPPGVDAWFERALAIDYEERFPTGKALTTSFSELCADLARGKASHAADGYAETVPADEAAPALSQTIALDSGVSHSGSRPQPNGHPTPAAAAWGHPAAAPSAGDPRAPFGAAPPGGHHQSSSGGSPSAASGGSYGYPHDGYSGGYPPVMNAGATQVGGSYPQASASGGAPAPRAHPTTMGGATAALRSVQRPSKRAPLLVFGAVLVAALGGGGFLLSRRLTTPDDEPGTSSAAPVASVPAIVAAPSAKKDATTVDVPAGMVHIPGGNYRIGCDPGEAHCYPDEQPAHVALLPAFAIMADEVTRTDYAVCANNKSCPPIPADGPCGGADEGPIRCVTWKAAEAYCAFKGWRLPSEEEWEAAARGSKSPRFPWGDAVPSCSVTVMRDARGPGCGSGSPAPKGHPKDVSAFGVKNMAGNLREWTSSPYAPYPGGTANNGDPANKINRGGSYLMDGEEMGAAFTRIPDEAEARRPDLGVRCAVNLPR